MCEAMGKLGGTSYAEGNMHIYEFGVVRKCAFEEAKFSSENWNCATMGMLRTLGDSNFYVNPPGAEVRSIDQTGSMLPFDGKFIVMGWYKSRGKVEAAVVVDEEKVRTLTLEVAELCLDFYRKINPQER